MWHKDTQLALESESDQEETDEMLRRKDGSEEEEEYYEVEEVESDEGEEEGRVDHGLIPCRLVCHVL